MKGRQKATGKTAKKGKGKAEAKRRKLKARQHYKDTVFRMLFNDKENLLSLYNAVNKTAYTDAGNLEITTLENAIYTNYKNDVSFVFGFELMLYEHQSTVNPNMPLRNLTYVTTVLQGITREENLYGSELVRVPSPKFVVFYNGNDFQPAQRVLRLSDAFLKKQEPPELELLVTVYNINWGYNQELMEACHLLGEYADFLTKNRAEAIAVSIFEYDEEKHMKSECEASMRRGIEQGREQGIRALIETSVELGGSKQETLERLMKKMQVSQEKAQESIEKYWH